MTFTRGHRDNDLYQMNAAIDLHSVGTGIMTFYRGHKYNDLDQGAQG